MIDELPQGWCDAGLTEVAEVFLGKTPARTDYTSSGSLKVVKFRDIHDGRVDFSNAKDGFVQNNRDALSGLRELRAGDVLITSAAHSGENIGKKCAYVSSLPDEFFRVFFTGELLNIRCLDDTLSRWAYLFFRSVDGFSEIQEAVTGVHLTGGRAKQMRLPVAPLPEQRQIVAKLEKLLEKVDACQQRLAKIPVLLKRFRQAVLAAACSGRLTADWREENESTENVEAQLSAAIAAVSAEYENDCKVAKRDNTRKPTRPTCLDNYESAWEDETDIPDTWSVVPLGKVCRKVTDGTHDTPKPTPSGVRYITAKHIRERRIDFENSLFLSQEDHDKIFIRCNPQRGDVLIVNIGAGTATPAMVRVNFEFSLKNVALLKPIKALLLGEFLELYQLLIKPQVFDEVTRGGAQPFMGLDLIKTIPFRLPPRAEQQEIVRRVTSLFALADQIEARYAKAKAHVERLTPSLLARAFRGELVPQDPNDEPASELLKRIRSNRHDSSEGSRRRARKAESKRAPNSLNGE
jgi:type I restriction enzyme S subunit